MNSNIFIAWSGNQALAYELKKLFDDKNFNVIVGGGSPNDMYVGAQVLKQINSCSCAILLVEDHGNSISHNLMFEWGYMMARMSPNDIHTFMINKSSRELPSDVLGTWVYEVKVDRSANDCDKTAAKEIYDIFIKNTQKSLKSSYFNIINEWTFIRNTFRDYKNYNERQICDYLVFGCLAAYYYMDNTYLRDILNTVNGSDNLNRLVLFGKKYIDVFLHSNNMTSPLPESVFFSCMQTFQSLIDQPHDLTDNAVLFVDLLCFDICGLSNILYLRNEGLDVGTHEYCKEKAAFYFDKMLELINTLEIRLPEEKCLIHLMRAYAYNDIAHLYNQEFNNNVKYLEYLAKSVEERKNLHLGFVAKYPENKFLAVKLEQEYMIALSEQCLHMEEGFLKKVSFNTIKAKYEEWQKEITFTSSLTDRIKNNIDKII